MERELHQPHIQCLHDFLGRSLAGWTCEKVYTLTLVFKKPVNGKEESPASREAAEFVFLGTPPSEFLFVASLELEILRQIYLSAELAWSNSEEMFIGPNCGLVDPERLSAVILAGFNQKKAFENPGGYSPKRRLLLRREVYERLTALDPLCFLPALGRHRPRKPPP